MTALTTERKTTFLGGEGPSPAYMSWPVAADAVIYTGALVVTNASGYAAPGTAATGKVTQGVAVETVDNTGGSNGDVRVNVKCGVALFALGTSGDAMTNADSGALCYIIDDQTVGKVSTGRSKAGVFLGLDPDGTGQAMVQVFAGASSGGPVGPTGPTGPTGP